MVAILHTIHLSLVWLSGFIYVAIVGAVFVFILRFRRDPAASTKYVGGKPIIRNAFFESIIVAIPMLILLLLFGWGYSIYKKQLQSPTDAYPVRLVGQNCHWIAHYGKSHSQTLDEIYVPLGRPVKLNVTSEDINYSLVVPDLQINQEIVPGLNTTLWFETHVAGHHPVFFKEKCSNLSANTHRDAQLIVLDEAEWRQWSTAQAKAQ